MTSTAAHMLDLVDDGALSIDPDGRIAAANSAAVRMLGWSRTALEGRALIDLELTPDILAAVTERQRADLIWRPAQGRRFMVSVRSNESGALLSLRDLEAFDYVRSRASGNGPVVANGHLAANRTRPDFALQRRLSPALHRILSRGERAVRQGARVLITGESGVGKSEIARFLHSIVSDSYAPFVICNCATSSGKGLAGDLFGQDDNPGLVADAEGGTLFLDEIAEMPLSVQARLLGYLEDGNQTSQFGVAPTAPGFRVVAATGTDLTTRVADGRFRADLFYRMAVVELCIPSLRHIPELVPHLTDRFLQTANLRRSTAVVLPQRFREILGDYAFPGNIRELLNIVQKATIFIDDAADMEDLIADLIRPIALPGDDQPAAASLDLKSEVRRFERALIDKAIRVHGSKRQAAKALGVDIGTIVRKTA